MCGGGSFGKLLKKGAGSIFGNGISEMLGRVDQKNAEASSPEAQQTKDDNAAQAVRKKKRLSEVLSSSENKKTTLGG